MKKKNKIKYGEKITVKDEHVDFINMFKDRIDSITNTIVLLSEQQKDCKKEMIKCIAKLYPETKGWHTFYNHDDNTITFVREIDN